MEHYRAVMLLHALGDTIGFKNGDWEFNYYEHEKLLVLDYVNELIYEFIDLGGVNGINLDGWHISDDTLLHIAMAKSMLKYKGSMNEKYIQIIKKNLLEMYREMEDDLQNKGIDRLIGITTQDSLSRFTDTRDARTMGYDDQAGGNGAAMRNLVIGMCLSGEKNREKLIDVSVISSMLTHNNAIGYLAGFTSALFTALAIEKQPIDTWVFELMKWLESDKLKSFLTLKNLDQAYDHNQYIRYWQKYLDTRFYDNKPLKTRSTANPMFRIRYYNDNFFKGTGSKQIGASGYLAMIMAYDSLLDCDGKWEKLIFYSILHSGDSDTVGAIAGGLYGAVYGMGDVPDNMLKYLERKEELIELADKLYRKFGSPD